jgi:hypothetical protein
LRIFNPRRLAHKRHHRVARQKTLRVMNQADLIAVHRMRDGQQLEVAEMRAQDEQPAPRMAPLELVPAIEAIVRDRRFKPWLENPSIRTYSAAPRPQFT